MDLILERPVHQRRKQVNPWATAPATTSATSPGTSLQEVTAEHQAQQEVTAENQAPTEVSKDDLPFDCEAGFQNWKKGWSYEKKQYCCDHEGKGCEDMTGSGGGATDAGFGGTYGGAEGASG